MRRVLDVVRMQAVNWHLLVLMPLGTLAVAFVVNLMIFGALGATVPPDGRVTGGIISIYGVVAASHLTTITQVFPFAVGLSVTRRTFSAAVAVVIAVQAVSVGLLLTVLELVERATGGWGMGLRFFDLPFVAQSNPLAQWAVFSAPLAAFSTVAVVVGVVFKRWGQIGLTVLLLGAALVLGLAVVVVTWQAWWPAIGGFFAAQSAFALLVASPLVIALGLGGVGWLAIRRAVP